MPTVKLPNGQKRTFPYNAVGKAQADSFAKMMKGKKKDNPGYGMEKKIKQFLFGKNKVLVMKLCIIQYCQS